MRVSEVFATPVEEKIEPVIKVGERGDEQKLAAEIGSYVVTPLIEGYLEDMLEHYTDTYLRKTTEIGIWISGYFGSGKSHFAKIFSLLVGNPTLQGATAARRFEARIPANAPRRASILRSLSLLGNGETDVLAFNLNTLADSKSRPLASLLLSQYYLSKGYSGNLIYARVIEAELDRQGKLAALHQAVETRARKPWAEVQRNLAFYRNHLYAAACEVAPEVFASADDVDKALKHAEQGELYNVSFLVDTILADLDERQARTRRPQRILFVLDESGQWIEDDAGRLSQLQALVEEAAIKGQGKIWMIVTTHGDMGAIFKEARALEGDMKKIEGRFRFKQALTTENIELVLEDRLFRKNEAGRQEILKQAEQRGFGSVRDLGELTNVTSRTLPPCAEEKFAVYYPFFPYQVHLIPEVVKNLRSKGGRGEQLSGSTRTLLAITQDVLRAGRRSFLSDEIGTVVSFDELYHNLAGEGEISPDVRTELSRIRETVPGATLLTQRVAEVLYLIRELPYIPRSRENLARLLAESLHDDLTSLYTRIDPELQRLMSARLVARIGEEYEFLTGERRTFEEEVERVEGELKTGEKERGLFQHFVFEPGKNHWRQWLDSDVVQYLQREFHFRLKFDDTDVSGTKGDVLLKVYSPLQVGRITVPDLENQSLRQGEEYTLAFLCGKVNSFAGDLSRYLAMKEVIGNWKSDPHKSEDARNLAHDRESDDLPKLFRKVVEGLKEGLRTGTLVFRGSSRQPAGQKGQTHGAALRNEMAGYWPKIYHKFERCPVLISNEQKAIPALLRGDGGSYKELADLKLFDKSGQVDANCPLLDDLRVALATRQGEGREMTGEWLRTQFCGPPYGWDPNVVRVGMAALVRASHVRLVVGKKEFSDPLDPEVEDCLRVSRRFEKAEFVLNQVEVEPGVLRDMRKFLMRLTRNRNLDETPAALSSAAETLGGETLRKAADVNLWARGAGVELPKAFTEGEEAWRTVLDLKNPVLRVNDIHAAQARLAEGLTAIEAHAEFQKQHGTVWQEIAELASRLEAVEHRLDAGTPMAQLVADVRSARGAASYADPAVWNSLQSLRSAALTDLPTLLDAWRAEATSIVDDALRRLPDELHERGIAAEREAELARPLQEFREGLPLLLTPGRVAVAADSARQLLRTLGRRLQELTPPPPAPPDDTGHPPPPDPEPVAKPVHFLHPTQLGSVTRITSLAEWETFQTKFDRRVRQLLEQGYDVDFS